MNATKVLELASLIVNNPQLKVRFMYPNGSSFHDYHYSSGAISKVELDRVFIDDDRIYFESHDEDEIQDLLFDIYASNMYPEIFESRTQCLTDEQCEEISKKAEVEYEKIEWATEIVVYLKEE